MKTICLTSRRDEGKCLTDLQNELAELKDREKLLEALIMEAIAKRQPVSNEEFREQIFDKKVLKLLSQGRKNLDILPWKPEGKQHVPYLPTLPTLASFVINEVLNGAYTQDSIEFVSIVESSPSETKCGDYTVITCNVSDDALQSKVNHSLSKELVTLNCLPSKISRPGERVNNNVIYHCIAEFQLKNGDNIVSEDQGNKLSVKFKLLTTDYKKMIKTAELKEGTKLTANHITGLIPSERCYEACTLYRGVRSCHDAPPREWPTKLDWCWCSRAQQEELNVEQLHVVNNVPHLDKGLYFITGPPGTGKSVMNAHALVRLMCHNLKERFMYAAPSNAAVNAGLLHLLSLRDRNLFPPDVHVAFIGPPDKLPQQHQELSISWFLTDLKEPFLKSKKNWGGDDNNYDILKCCRVLKKKLNKAVEKIEKLLETTQTMNAESEGVLSTIKDAIKTFNELIKTLDDETTTKKMTMLKLMLIDIINNIANSKHYFEMFHVQRANVIFTTLSSSGRPFLRKCFSNLDVLIIDEAAQCHVPEVLIPIMHFSPRVSVLVGDPKQLPPIVSPFAEKRGYGVSLMSSFTTSARPNLSWMLRENYRMHPDICAWPSQKYYDSTLLSSDLVKGRADIDICLPPGGDNDNHSSVGGRHSAFIDVPAGEEKKEGKSYFNLAEANEVVKTVKDLLISGRALSSATGVTAPTIGVITFYRAQVKLIKKLLEEARPGIYSTTQCQPYQLNPRTQCIIINNSRNTS